MKIRNLKNNNIKRAGGALLAVLLVVFTWQVAMRHASTGSKDLETVKSQVGKLMILPDNEQPTLATVEDKTKLKDSYLASHAQNGDRLLIYANNHMVIIYRPDINKIAGIGTVTIDQALAQSKNTSLTILDGSNNPEKTQNIIGKIRAVYPDIKITEGGSTARQDFPTTIVIDNSNQRDELLLKLTSILNAKQGVVPLGVEKANTDMMIIVGQDSQ